jgi:hypothetical protein
MKTAACRACDCGAAGQPLSQSRACADARHARARRALLQRVQARTCSAGPCQAAHGCRAQTPRCATGHGALWSLLLHCGGPDWARACGHVSTPAAPMALPDKLYALPLTQGHQGDCQGTRKRDACKPCLVRVQLHLKLNAAQVCLSFPDLLLRFVLSTRGAVHLCCVQSVSFSKKESRTCRAGSVLQLAHAGAQQQRSWCTARQRTDGCVCSSPVQHVGHHAHSAPLLHMRLPSGVRACVGQALQHRGNTLEDVGQEPSACLGPC